ncbi:uncharacterized protein LOC109800304 [Cajanus cajan]|uniref:uncharacterized protein LOC109800304 n=1 Tax=Cajanus cajan TaxID=3821 RepID=UPI00098DAE61|nr:uncharacterized protein LOC109800304 [Cajanus cajan]
MAEERPRITLGDHATATSTTHFSSIATPAIAATNFEMKPALLNLIQNNQFAGLDHEDPYLHLHTFIELCGTVKIHQVPEEVIRMKLFPFSLLGKAKMWLNALPHQSLTRWSDIETKFLARFFPLAKINQAKSEIVTFSQKQDELLSEAWERYKSLLRRCPSHGFDDLTQVNIFLGGLQPRVKILLDASAGGSMRFKTPEEAIELIDAMSANDYDLPAERESRQKRGILELGSQDALLAQNKLLSQQIEALTKKVARIPQQLQSTQHQVLSCDLCELNHPHGQCIDIFLSHGQEVNYMGNQARQGGNFGANTQTNPKENCSAITTRGGKRVGVLEDEEEQQEKEVEMREGDGENNEKNKKLENAKKNVIEGEELAEEVAVKKSKSQLARELKMKSKVSSTKDMPYPPAPSKKDKEKQFVRFMELFKKLQINIPFSKALEQMPTYEKFMKDLLTKKRKFIEQEIIKLEAGCSAIIQKNLPPKFKDPGSFTILITIGDLSVGRSLTSYDREGNQVGKRPERSTCPSALSFMRREGLKSSCHVSEDPIRQKPSDPPYR